MNAEEIIAKWNKEHPTDTPLADDAQRLLQMLADGDAENASTLAAEIAKRKAEEIAAKKEAEIKRLEHILGNFDKDDSFLEDHSPGKIWSLTMKADGKANEYVDEVLNTWKKPFQQALETYREAIEKLCTRWGFASVGGMLQTIFDANFCDTDFYNIDCEGYYSICAHTLRLSDIEDDYEVEERLGEAAEEYIRKNRKEISDLILADTLLKLRENGSCPEATVCDAVFICFYPDVIKSVCAAENTLAILFCFLNAATMTRTDEAVRKAQLKKRIATLKKEATCGAPVV